MPTINLISPTGSVGSIQYKSIAGFAGDANLMWDGSILAANNASNGAQLQLYRGASLNLQLVGNNGAPSIVGNTGGGTGVFRITASGGGTGGLELSAGEKFTVQTSGISRVTVNNTGATTINAVTGNPLTVQANGVNALVIDSLSKATFGGNVLLNSASPTLYLGNDSDQYITGNAASNYLTISTGNVERVRIDSSGKVGIGTATPSSKLDVAGDIEIGSANYSYIGDPTTDGSWRIGLSGNNLVMERRESSSWVTKQTISA